MSNANPKYDKSKVLIDIKRKLKEGLTSAEITDWIKRNYEISNQSIIFLMGEAKELYTRELDFNYRDIMIKHAGRYEQIWKKNYTNPFSKKLENPEDDLDDKEIRKTLFKIAKHYMIAADALRAKEKMLGLTHNRMDVELKNEYVQQEEKNNVPEFDVSRYDLSKLELAEKIELLHLIKKSKGEAEETSEIKVTTRVTIAQNNTENELKYDENVVSQFDVEDIEHEEITEPEPPAILVENINREVIMSEVKKEAEIKKELEEAERKRKFEAAKKKILAKYKANK